MTLFTADFISGILTAQQAQSPSSAACNIAPERWGRGEVCPQAEGGESPEMTPEMTEKNMDAVELHPENLNLRADMQIQDECSTSED